MSAVSQIACHKYSHECLTDDKCFCLLSERCSGAVRVILTDIMSSRSTCWFKYRKSSGLNYRLLRTAGGIIEWDTRKRCVCVCVFAEEWDYYNSFQHTHIVCKTFYSLQWLLQVVLFDMQSLDWPDLRIIHSKSGQNTNIYIHTLLKTHPKWHI